MGVCRIDHPSRWRHQQMCTTGVLKDWAVSDSTRRGYQGLAMYSSLSGDHAGLEFVFQDTIPFAIRVTDKVLLRPCGKASWTPRLQNFFYSLPFGCKKKSTFSIEEKSIDDTFKASAVYNLSIKQRFGVRGTSFPDQDIHETSFTHACTWLINRHPIRSKVSGKYCFNISFRNAWHV